MCADLTAQARDRVGKGAARAARREGLVPAVIYGEKQSPLSINLTYKDVEKRIYSGGFLSTTLTVDVDGEEHKVIPRDYQLEPVRDFIMHIDFLRIGKDTKLNVEVPVQFINEEESPGIKRGGVLNIVRHTVELECPADQIPEQLIADLTGLDVGDGVHISSIDLPEGIQPTITDRDFTIATVAAPSVLRSQENEGDVDSDIEGEEGEGEQEAATGEGSDE